MEVTVGGKSWPYLVAILQVVVAVTAALALINPFREPMLWAFAFAGVLFLTTAPVHFWIRTRGSEEVIHGRNRPSFLTREFQQKQSTEFNQYLYFHSILSLCSMAIFLGVIFFGLLQDMRLGASSH